MPSYLRSVARVLNLLCWGYQTQDALGIRKEMNAVWCVCKVLHDYSFPNDHLQIALCSRRMCRWSRHLDHTIINEIHLSASKATCNITAKCKQSRMEDAGAPEGTDAKLAPFSYYFLR